MVEQFQQSTSTTWQSPVLLTQLFPMTNRCSFPSHAPPVYLQMSQRITVKRHVQMFNGTQIHNPSVLLCCVYMNRKRQDKILTRHFNIRNKDDGPPPHGSMYFQYCRFTPSDSSCTTSVKFNLTAIRLVLSFWIQTESLSFTSEAAISS